MLRGDLLQKVQQHDGIHATAQTHQEGAVRREDGRQQAGDT
jgi:hypothetical protein